MLNLLRQIRAMLALTGLDLGEILAIFKRFAELGPPDVTNGLKLRAWLSNLLAIFDTIAAETPTELDDGAVDMLGAILANDAAWDVTYSLIELLLGDGEEAAAVGKADEIATALGPEVGNPAMILMIIQGIVFVIQQLQRWRDR